MYKVLGKFLIDVGDLDSTFDWFSTHWGVESVLSLIFEHNVLSERKKGLWCFVSKRYNTVRFLFENKNGFESRLKRYVQNLFKAIIFIK